MTCIVCAKAECVYRSRGDGRHTQWTPITHSGRTAGHTYQESRTVRLSESDQRAREPTSRRRAVSVTGFAHRETGDIPRILLQRKCRRCWQCINGVGSFPKRTKVQQPKNLWTDQGSVVSASVWPSLATRICIPLRSGSGVSDLLCVGPGFPVMHSCRD